MQKSTLATEILTILEERTKAKQRSTVTKIYDSLTTQVSFERVRAKIMDLQKKGILQTEKKGRERSVFFSDKIK